MSTPHVVPTREGYDRWAQIYDDEDNPLIALETPLFRRLLGDVRGLTGADIGCGTGRHALAMAEAGARVIAVDFSGGMLSKARAKPHATTVHFVRHDVATGLPFLARAFDCVTCCLVLEILGIWRVCWVRWPGFVGSAAPSASLTPIRLSGSWASRRNSPIPPPAGRRVRPV